jgi:hypothetical protein
MRSPSFGDDPTMPPPNREGGFDEYRMLILQSLQTLERKVETLPKDISDVRESLQKDITEIKVAVGQLQVRAGLLGALGGAIGGAIISVLVAKAFG